MRKLFTSIILTGISLIIFNSCSNNATAENMAKKWCSCNEKMGVLMTAFHQEKDEQQKTEIALKVSTEQQYVLLCMGGEDSLKKLNDAQKGSNFQEIYDKTRNKICPELLLILNKKGAN